LDCVDRKLRDLTATDKPFGGKVVLFGGDFRQVLPVLRHAERAKIVRMTIKRWKEWRKVRQLQLLDNMCVRRVYDDPASADRFAAWLLRVGDGRETTVQDTDLIRVPSDMIVHSIAELVNSVFPDLSDERLYVNRAILAPKNDDADKVNDFVVNQLTGTICEYKSVESFDTNECAQYPIEYLNTLTPPGIPPHRLRLKVGYPVILLRNLNADDGL